MLEEDPAPERGEARPAAVGAWRGALERIDAAWQWVEARLCAGVLVAEIAALTLWVSLKGLSADYVRGSNASGLVYRSIVTAVALGIAAHLATRRSTEKLQRVATTFAVLAGLVAGRSWSHLGTAYASNLLNWLQNASALMLIGGLRGLATRLTLWLALLGASLATSRGKHIHIDMVLRYVPARLRVATAIAGQLAAAVVCALGVAGFLDYISIAAYRAPAVEPCPSDAKRSCDTPAAEKFAVVLREASSDVFLLGRQLSLDSKSLPRVVAGTAYDKWMTAEAWNAWLDGAQWTAHFDRAAVDALRMPPSSASASGVESAPTYRMPQVAVPGTGEEARGLLIRELTFVFPVGLAVLAMKFLLRVLLILAGSVSVDPEATHREEDLTHARRREETAARTIATSET